MSGDRSTKRSLLYTAAAIALLVAVFVVWMMDNRTARVSVWRVKKITLVSQVLSTGEVQSGLRQFVFESALPGSFKRFDVQVGQRVTAGHALVTVDQTGGVETTVSARFAGTVLLENPDGVDADGNPAPLLELVSAKRKVVVPLSEEDAVHVTTGMQAAVTSEAYPNRSWQGTVTRVYDYASPSANGGANQVNVEITPKDPFSIPYGYQVNVSLHLQTKNRVVVLPYTALVQNGSRYVVYVVQNGKSVAHTVTLGATANNVVEVTSGVRAGAVVVNNPPANLRSGEKVTPA